MKKMNKSFIILRRELTGFSTRGPIAVAMSLDEARAETLRLNSTFPYQHFVMGRVGRAKPTKSITIRDALRSPQPQKQQRVSQAVMPL